MSKPVYGDPSVDVEARRLALMLKKKITRAYCRNLDLTAARLLAKVCKHVIAELDDAVYTKLRQSIGGMQGANKRVRRVVNQF